MTPRKLRRPSGVTLIELMVALVVSAVVLAGVVATVASQQQAYYAGHRARSAQASARAAQLYVEQKLRDAGLGMDPSLALDFNFYGRSQPLADATLCPAAMNGCPRDATANSDELVFYARNKSYRTFDPTTGLQVNPPVGRAWTLVDQGTPGAVNINAGNNPTTGDRFLKGQILQAVCADGNTFAYFTVAATNPPPASSAATAPTQLQLTLEPFKTNDPFRRQDIINANPCFAGALVFQIDRYRFHVTFPVNITAQPDLTQPYLALDMGVDRNLDGVVDYQDELLIAEGVELLQVAYVFLNGALQPVGDGIAAVPGTAIQFANTIGNVTPLLLGDQAANTIYLTTFGNLTAPAPHFGVTPSGGRTDYFPPSFFQFPSVHLQRQNDNQANIRAVKVAILARSPEVDVSTRANIKIDGNFTLFNLRGPVAWIGLNPNSGIPFDDGYQRIVVQSTVPMGNVLLRATPLF